MAEPASRFRSFTERLPVFSSYHELDVAPRRFLFFSVFNLISWQCVVGSVLVLFARRIEMPPSWVGFLISFLPLSMVLVAGTAPLVAHLGPKRLMLATWLLRNLIACSVFAMPWAIARGGPRAGWYVLMGATLGFCVFRAIGVSGWFPWLHEVVREGKRGAYFSSETSFSNLMNVVVVLGQALALRGEPGVNRFLWVYGAGVTAGIVSVYWLSRVPGGRGIEEQRLSWDHSSAYRAALADRHFLVYVVTAALCLSCLSCYSSAIVLYMRDALDMASKNIMMLMAAGSVGILLTVGSWGRFAEHSGSGRAMFKTLIAHAMVALALLGLAPGTRWTLYALVPIVILASMFNAAFWVAANRAMLNYVREEGRIGYTSIWVLGTSVMAGVTPIAVGMTIQTWGPWGYRACFAASCTGALACALVCRRVVRDGPPMGPITLRTLNPIWPILTLARIVRITTGRHESNKSRGGN